MKININRSKYVMINLLIGFFFLLSGFHSVFADNKTHILTLNEFIEECVKNNPEIFHELEKIKLADADIQKTHGAYDTVFNAYYMRQYDEPFTDYSAVKIDNQSEDILGFGFQRMFPQTGTRLKAGFGYSRNKMDNVRVPGSPASNITYYNPYHDIELQQPLLKNWLGIIDKFPMKQAKLNKLITQVTVDESIEMIISDLYSIYFNWYLEYGKLRAYERNVQNSLDLMKRTESRFKAGLSLRTDFLLTEKEYLTYVKVRDESRVNLENFTRKIKSWYSGNNDGRSIIPEDKPGLSGSDMTAPEITDLRQMQILSLTKDLLYAKLKKENNEILPDLNLSLKSSKAAYNNNPGFAPWNLDYNQYSAGLTFTYTIGSNENKGNIKSVESGFEQWRQDVSKYERDYSQSCHEINKLMNLMSGFLQYDSRLLKNASDSLSEREKRYQRGQEDIYYVIEDRNSALNQEITELQDYVKLQVLKVQFLALTDRLKDKGGN